MKTVLVINSSGRNDGSVTRNITQQITATLNQQKPSTQIIHRDVATGLPFIDNQWIAANFTPSEERSNEQQNKLEFSDSLVNELQQADHIIIGVPIYNFGIPATLKAWIDLIARAKLTFKYTDNGPVGLLDNKKATLVMASGGVPIGSAMDFASPYLKQALNFIGINDITIIDANNESLANNDLEALVNSF